MQSLSSLFGSKHSNVRMGECSACKYVWCIFFPCCTYSLLFMDFFFVEFVNFTHRVISKLGISCCLEDSTAYLMNFSANAVPSMQ